MTPSLPSDSLECVRIYHRTTWTNARTILREGFVDSDNPARSRKGYGVWLASEALDEHPVRKVKLSSLLRSRVE